MNDALNQSKSLILRAQNGDIDAMKTMVEDNLALVKYVIKRFSNAKRDWDDLYQLGCMGLVKAIKHFDLSFDVRFSTYAVPVIMGEVRRFLRDDGPMRVSRSIRENAAKITRYMADHQAQSGKLPTIADVAQALDMDRESVLLALDSTRATQSLSQPIAAGSNLTLGDTIGHDEMDKIDRRIELEQLLKLLNPRERELLKRRYYDRQTQSQIAADFGMTQVQVSRLESKLLKRLRSAGECAG